MRAIDLVWQWVPRHRWVRLTFVWDGRMTREHAWIGEGTIRRDAWRVGRFGLGVMRRPSPDSRGRNRAPRIR